MQQGAGALGGFGRIFFENVALSGRAPQISVITGTSAGGGCYSPALTDFVVMSGEASMFLTGPKIVKHALGEDVSTTELGGPQVHERNGVCDFVALDDRDAIALVRELLGYLPQNASEAPPVRAPAEPVGTDPAVALPARSRSYYDVRDVIARLVDGGRAARGGTRLGPQPRHRLRPPRRSVGRRVANQPAHRRRARTVAAQKGARFVRTCDAFGLPLLVLVDTPGYMPGGARRPPASSAPEPVVQAFADATLPRITTVILRKAFGGAFITLNSKDLGADSYPHGRSRRSGSMGAKPAVGVIHRHQLAAPTSRGRARAVGRAVRRDAAASRGGRGAGIRR